MRVVVTGASGFLGCHTVAALLDGGHSVRAVGRSPERLRASLEQVAANSDEVQPYIGDVTDSAFVESALGGCDAVVHAAAVVSLGPRGAHQTYLANVRGGKAVLGTAHRLGLDPIVHISGVPALLPCRDAVLHPDSALGDPPSGYLRSKVAAEEAARRLQASGAPVVIVQPGLMLGPYDPKLGMGTRLIRDALTGKMPLVPAAGLPLNDVRDQAAAVARAVEPGRGPRRYTTGGAYCRFADMVDLIAEVAGRPIARTVVSPRLALAAGRLADLAQRVLPTPLPITGASAWVALHDPHTDDSRARDELGFAPRELRITIADTIQSLLVTGRLSPSDAAIRAPGPDGVVDSFAGLSERRHQTAELDRSINAIVERLP